MSLSLNLRGEDAIQAEIIQWSYKESKNCAPLWLLHHIPNGGWRGYAQGMRFKALGVKSGVPDLCLPCARHGYNGLYIEVKDGAKGSKSKQSPAQIEWEKQLKAENYFVRVVKTSEEGIETIKWYLNL